MGMYSRFIVPKMAEAARDTPVLVVVGARQVGKSTLLKELLPIKTKYLTLDDLSTLSAARTDPDSLLRCEDDETLVLDEAQLAPELMRTIKKLVDSDRKNRKYILSGSADIMTLPKLLESLAGRCEIFYMYPLSQTEILNSSSNFVDSLFDENFAPADFECDFSRLAQIMRGGGYPEALERKSARAAAWFKSYLTAIIQRDARDIANISDIAALQTILELLARRCGNLLNASDISRLSGVKNTTTQRYISILEKVFLVYRNKPWHRTVDARLVKTPKAYLNDSGLLCHLLGVSLEDLIDKKSPFTGAVLENFVFNEIQKQISWSRANPEMYHFRSVGGREVDFILELRNRQKIGVEIKASSTVTNSDFNGLNEFKRLVGEDFLRGIVLYCGNKALRFGQNLFAVPIANLFGKKP
jgi:predicted AAA+ superfamily ATPase